MADAAAHVMWAHALDEPEIVGWTQRESLPNISALYYITGSYEFLLYVGQTTHLHDRFTNHHRLPTLLKVLDDPLDGNLSINYCPVDPTVLLVAESRMIDNGNPPLNNTPRVSPPVCLSAWISQALFEKLDAYARGLSDATGARVDIPDAVAAILARHLA